MSVVSLKKIGENKFECPVCNSALEYNSGGAVRIVNGQVDYENTKPRYICYSCNKFYRELLDSGFYDVFDLEEELRKPKTKKVVKKTGDLAPMILKKDADGTCECPRCGERMNYIEAGAVRIVNGVPDFSNTVAHFACDSCNSVYRRIASTEYFQWDEK